MRANETFRALMVEQQDGKTRATIADMPFAGLPEGDTVIAVSYSSINYKDGLAVTGQGKIISKFPMIPGIDLAGTVVETQSSILRRGEQVILTGWGTGEERWGGYAALARARSEWLVRLPLGFSAQDAMTIGTAGLTAALSLQELEDRGLEPANGEVVVTGAGGGVGSVAVALLAANGYRVVASTGRPELHDYLRSLGASEIIDRSVLSAPSEKPLESARWAGAIDTVGGTTLAGLMRIMASGGSIAACGLAGGSELHTTVFPLILRGVNLIGIETSRSPMEPRRAAWLRLARDLDRSVLDRIVQVAPLADVPHLAEEILSGRIRGRIVVDVNG